MTRAVMDTIGIHEDEGNGNHVVLWYKTAKGRARAISGFLGPGVSGDSLIAIILPLRELEQTEEHLREGGFPIDRLMDEERLSFFASEEFLPADPRDCSRIGLALKELRGKAEAQGRSLMLVGRVAPLLFERGEVDHAMHVERIADSALGDAKLLCLYDASGFRATNKGDVNKVNSAHTHAMFELSGGKVRAAASKKRAAKRKKSRRKSR